MKLVSFVYGTLMVFFICSGFAIADRLPYQVPENQVFSIDTVLDSTGIIDDSSSLKWIIVNQNATPTGPLGYQQTVADSTFSDSTLTNGGKLGSNKNFDFNSKSITRGFPNVAMEKVLTYASTEGAHMVGEEEYTLDVAGNWYAETPNEIRCVFTSNPRVGYPAFCNVVSAKSNLININSAQISTKGRIHAERTFIDDPAELFYQIAVTPDQNAGSGFAEGTVSTTFAGSIKEARDWAGYITVRNWNNTSAENSWKDSTTVTGGIKNFQKVFGYQSGIRLQ